MVGDKVHLIAGGRLKEDDLDFLDLELSTAVTQAYLIGEAEGPLFDAWQDLCPCQRCGTMEVAVAQAMVAAKPGDVLLLSPGCASFDQYAGMAKRGEHFKACVEKHGELR
jgi:UDP-N-acetylmuramoylalanine--D-glutamate ligase